MKIDPDEYFAHIEIPAVGWSNVSDFRKWYLDARMPIRPPNNAGVFITDDATAMCVFRAPPYQVELYLIHPNEVVDRHCHPGMETELMSLGGGSDGGGSLGISGLFGGIAPVIFDEQHHGGNPEPLGGGGLSLGCAMLTFEKWPKNVPMTSASVRWKGNTAGPRHEALIREYYPNAYVIDGYADVTRAKD